MDIDHILSELNPEQLRAVTHAQDESMLVLAGAGSGKTKVLTTRISWLVKHCKVDPQSVLAVTFTNKAAKEMLHRVSHALEATTDSIWIGTFHSIALRILSKHHKEASLPAYFQILDSQDQLGILRRLIRAADLDEERYTPKELQRFIGNQKEQGLRARDIVANGLRHEHWIQLYADYEAMCNRSGLVDFTELLLRGYEVLLAHSEVLERYQTQFKHILIDEFQDTNQLQYQWLKLISGKSAKLFAVGDDDQSIYAFRGAKVANLQSFIGDFAVKDPIRLEQNYRSTPNILTAANVVISNNSGRIGKNLWTQNTITEKIHLYEAYTEEDEAYFVADEINSLRNKGVNLSEIAVLYRSNAQSRLFEQFFCNRGIPYRVYGGQRFFDRQEVKHVLSYLRLLINDGDDEAFLRVVNFPARGIGAVALKNLQNVAAERQVSLFNACDGLDGRGGPNLNKFTILIKLMQDGVRNLNLAETINYIIEASGIKQHYSEDRKTGHERLENLNELISAVTTFEANGNTSVSDFLAHAVLESSADDQHGQASQSSVQLLTVHAAKGLEFQAVFIVGLEEGLFPHENSLQSTKDTEEERRLMYVAITRAKEKLYLLRACSRLSWGKRQSAPISRFVNEIPGELISNISGISAIGSSSLLEYGMPSLLMDENSRGQAQMMGNPETKISRITLSDQDITIKIGDMVKHAKFGNGKVMNLHVEGKKMTGEIFFIGIGKKMLDLNIAKIERV